jgi:hypothetical protein
MGFELPTGSDTNWVRLGCELLGPGRKRRGKPTAFWLWFLVGAIAILVVLVWVLRSGASANSRSPFVLPGDCHPFSVASPVAGISRTGGLQISPFVSTQQPRTARLPPCRSR